MLDYRKEYKYLSYRRGTVRLLRGSVLAKIRRGYSADIADLE